MGLHTERTRNGTGLASVCIGIPNVQPTGLPKSQKIRPNRTKWQPPGRFLKRFPFACDRAEWGYYPKPPTI